MITHPLNEKPSLQPQGVLAMLLALWQNPQPSVETRNNLSTANNSTPLNRAIFVRSLRTPKINQAQNGSVKFSMVKRSGQSLRLAVFPLVAVFHPVTFYRQAWKLAVDTHKLSTELSQMLFKFLLLGKNRLRITIRAKSEAEARQKLHLSSQAICYARFKGGIYA